MFLVPWWWYLWSRGPRFSLRRLIGRALLGCLLGALLGGAAAWAFGGRAAAPWLAALAYGELGAGLGAIWSLVEPLWIVLSASLLARRMTTETLRGVSFGLMFAYAVLAGYALYATSSHVEIFANWLATLRRSDGFVAGSLRFITGASLICYPIVIAARQTLIAFDRAAAEPRPSRRVASPGPAFAAREPQTFMPPPRPSAAPQTIEPPKPPPARVVRTDAGPLRPPGRDG
jgi:hypothetical protein